MYWRIVFIVAAAALAGCQISPQQPAPPVSPVEEAPPQAEPLPKVVASEEEVAILVSSDIPAYRQVAEEVAQRLARRAQIWYLPSGEKRSRALEEIARSARQQVVAVGLDAALASKKLAGKRVIFCQVFAYEDQRLVAPSRKGVAMLPSFDKTIAAWRALSPETKRIALITGPSVQDLVQLATQAAKRQGIEVIHQQVESDKEFLLVYKNMAASVQGYWLWPDNRILSGSVIQDVMNFSVRSGKQVLVFNDELLALGGLFSATSNVSDIAAHVVERLQRSAGKKVIPGEAIEPLEAVNLSINPIMAKRFGLEVPEQYRKYVHGP